MGLHPVVAKGRLHLGDRRAFDFVMGVAPVILRAAVAGPHVGDADSARKSDPAVHHQQLAMGAIIQAGQIIPAQRMVPLDLDACGLHGGQKFPIDLVGAQPVQQYMNLHPGLRPLAQGIRELPADVARPINVGFERDRFLGGPNRLQHGRKYLIAVLQRRHPVAGQDCGAEQLAHAAQELRIVDGKPVGQLITDFPLPTPGDAAAGNKKAGN